MTLFHVILDQAAQGNFSFFILVGTIWTITLMYMERRRNR
jgi:hypothetical protein